MWFKDIGRQTVSALSIACNKASMKCAVIVGHLLACASAVTIEPGYGVPAATIEPGYGVPAAPLVVLPQPAPVARLPLQLVHQPVPAPLPLQAPLPLAPAPVHFAQAPLTLAQAPLPFAPAPLPFAQAPLPIAQAPLPIAHAPLPLAQAPLHLAQAPLPLAPAPLPLAAAPLPFGPAPVAAIPTNPSSQFHAQDEFGQFSFGYDNINSAKTESRDAFGVTRGSYQYVDANGILQTVNYIADPVNGFRVAGTNIPVAPGLPNVALPVAPEAAAVVPLVAPLPVKETAEVAAARAEHLAAHEEAKAAIAALEDTVEEPSTEASS